MGHSQPINIRLCRCYHLNTSFAMMSRSQIWGIWEVRVMGDVCQLIWWSRSRIILPDSLRPLGCDEAKNFTAGLMKIPFIGNKLYLCGWGRWYHLRPLHSASEVGEEKFTFLEVLMSPWLVSKLEKKVWMSPVLWCGPGPRVTGSDNLADWLTGWLVV